MDLHPLVVHFPIALLVLWSVVEIIRPARWFSHVSWGSASAIMLIAGFVGAFAALTTGDIAGEEMGGDVVCAHETFAQLATFLYGLFVVDVMIPLVLLVSGRVFSSSIANGVTRAARMYERVFQMRGVRVLLALVALIAITITGILGGILVYGVEIDPFAPIVLSLLGISL